MRDINDIIQQNNDTWRPVIDNLVRQGRYVVAQYDGLHLVSIESFSDLRRAQDAADHVNAAVGSRSELHFPITDGLVSAYAVKTAPGGLQGDPDSFAYRQATRREEREQVERRWANQINHSLTALQAAALARPRDLTLETENTADRAFDRAADDLAREVRARRALGHMVDDLTREERDRVAEGGLVSQEV